MEDSGQLKNQLHYGGRWLPDFLAMGANAESHLPGY